jgi:hypothetical protein
MKSIIKMKKLLVIICFLSAICGNAQSDKVVFDTKVGMFSPDGKGKASAYGSTKNREAVLISSEDAEKLDILYYDKTIYGLLFNEKGEIDYAQSGLMPINEAIVSEVKMTDETQVIKGLKSRKFDILMKGSTMQMQVWIATDYTFSDTFLLSSMCGKDMDAKCKGLITRMDIVLDGMPPMTAMDISGVESTSKTLIVDAKKLKAIKEGNQMFQMPNVEETVIEEPIPTESPEITVEPVSEPVKESTAKTGGTQTGRAAEKSKK